MSQHTDFPAEDMEGEGKKLWLPPTEWEKGVQEIEATERTTQLEDGRVMSESRLTLSPEWMDQLWKGYRCAACLERLLVAFPERCPNEWCAFPVKAEQLRRLQIDFVGQQPTPLAGFSLEREQEYLREQHRKKQPRVMTMPRKK